MDWEYRAKWIANMAVLFQGKSDMWDAMLRYSKRFGEIFGDVP